MSLSWFGKKVNEALTPPQSARQHSPASSEYSTSQFSTSAGVGPMSFVAHQDSLAKVNLDTFNASFATDRLQRFLSLMERMCWTEAGEFAKRTQVAADKEGFYWADLSKFLDLWSLCESQYYECTHLVPRKDRLKSLYESVGINVSNRSNELRHTTHEGREFVCTLLDQIFQLTTARTCFVDYYRWLYDTHPPYDFQKMLTTTKLLDDKFANFLTHPYLTGIQANIRCEVRALRKTVEAQLALCNYNLKDTIFLNAQAKSELAKWRSLWTSSESRESSRATTCKLYQWLCLFCDAMTSKTTLYFHRILQQCEHESGGDMSGVWPSLPINYKYNIEMFVNKSEAYSVSIVLQADGLDYSDRGYMCLPEGHQTETLTGLRSWPVIFSHPVEHSVAPHMPNIVSILMDSAAVLKQCKDLVYHNEAKRQHSYVVARIEANFYLVIIFTDRKRQHDKTTSDFFQYLCDSLRLGRVFSKLKIAT